MNLEPLVEYSYLVQPETSNLTAKYSPSPLSSSVWLFSALQDS